MACSSLHVIVLIFLLPFCALAQNNGTVPLGSILTANETARPWLSPSGDFAFGFRQLENNKDMFLLSIWYNNLPQQTVAWYTNSIDAVPRGSTVELNAGSGLVLRDPQGRQIWITENIADQVDHGFMNDTGNFVIMRRDNSWLWESFQFAADTILPSQQLVYGSVLISRESETNFSRGRFNLRFLDDGNLVLTGVPTNSGDEVEYYNSQTSDPLNASNSGIRVIFDMSGSLYILRGNNRRRALTPASIPLASLNFFRATLNFDGVFTHYYHPRNFTGTANWTAVWFAPDNICNNTDAGKGPCGYNSICRLVNSRAICDCPERYQLLDPNDKYGNCKPNYTQSCNGVEKVQDFYDFVELSNTDWLKSDSEMLMNYTEENCRQSCLQDCFCAVAIFRDNICWKKQLPLLNGWTDLSLNSKAFVKYNIRDVPKGQPSKGNRVLIVESVFLGISVFINVLFVVAACYGFHFIYGKMKLKHNPRNDAVGSNLICFTYKELEEATNGFKEELGRGSFGIVYKGQIKMALGGTVAIKKLDRVVQLDLEKEFRAEVNAIGQTHHKNLVRLLGFCDEGQHRLLVYEYMSGGTLASFLFSNPKPSWSLRTQIACGIARGLAYLHEECGTQIIHCDIKPQNILLDDQSNARISDFGLAKLLELNQSRTHTNIRGTKGYVAPEWFRINSQINAKVDVYSFGVLLLEIISCRRSVEVEEIGEGENAILIDWVWDCFQERRLDTLVENDLEALNDMNKLENFVMIGIWCIQENSSLRPTMRKVSHMLEGVVEVMAPPCPFPSSFAS